MIRLCINLKRVRWHTCIPLKPIRFTSFMFFGTDSLPVPDSPFLHILHWLTHLLSVSFIINIKTELEFVGNLFRVHKGPPGVSGSFVRISKIVCFADLLYSAKIKKVWRDKSGFRVKSYWDIKKKRELVYLGQTWQNLWFFSDSRQATLTFIGNPVLKFNVEM